MTPEQAIEFVQTHGVVMESATGRLPSLAQAIAGEQISGSWWAHAKGKEIFRLTRAVRSSPEILVCRLVAGKITFVHARVWPALVHFGASYRADQIARLTEQHTSRGRHRVTAVPFPAWVPASTLVEASRLTAEAAFAMLGPVAPGSSGAT